jgi:hypothetical protein
MGATASHMSTDPPITVMVSSAIRGIEDLLDQIFVVLQQFGYTVWMSHKGTIPLSSNRSAFENCLEAVDRCDVLLGIITGRYGSGQNRPKDELSILDQEIRRAVDRNKVRFFAVHHHVTLARELLRQFRFGDDGNIRHHSFFRRTNVLDDIRILDMYDYAIRDDLPLGERIGNWAQEYTQPQELLQFVSAQFSNPDRIRELLRQRAEEHKS